MVQLGDHVRKPAVVEACARVLAVEEMVHAVQEPAYRKTGKEVQSRTFFLANIVVRMALARKRHGRFHIGDAGEREGR